MLNHIEGHGENVPDAANQEDGLDIAPSEKHSTSKENPGPIGEPDSSVDILDENGQVKTRRQYDSEGKAYRDVDMTDHGNPKQHPEVPHEHTWDWSSGGPIRKQELKMNGLLLKNHNQYYSFFVKRLTKFQHFLQSITG